jgi:hypothetical protein
MNTWLKLKTKPFGDSKPINPKRKYKAGFADGDIVVFVISKDSMIETHSR